MQAVQIGYTGPIAAAPIAAPEPTPQNFTSMLFYGRTRAEQILTILQIAAALFTIAVAIRVLFLKK